MKVVSQGVSLIYFEDIKSRAEFMLSLLEINDKYIVGGAQIELSEARNLIKAIDQAILFVNESTAEVSIFQTDFRDKKTSEEA